MNPRVTVLTLGVDDLDRALAFYRDGLGFATDGIVGSQFEFGAVVFIQLQAGLRLALWPRKSIAHDTGLSLSKPSAIDMTLGHNVASKSEVDAVMALARQAGAVAQVEVSAFEPAVAAATRLATFDHGDQLWDAVAPLGP